MVSMSAMAINSSSAYSFDVIMSQNSDATKDRSPRKGVLPLKIKFAGSLVDGSEIIGEGQFHI